ncbi:MAG: menaquinone biosynthesis protein [Phycisphaerae bacterium]|jgi:chorismate dehydratase
MAWQLGVVSFLNSRPLIDGLDEDPDVRCLFDVPAALAARLAAGEVDAALIPIVDVLRAAGRYQVVSDACIGSDGETMTVRVFSRVPPEELTTLWVDPDSHTSVALARVLWQERFGRQLTLQPLSPLSAGLAGVEAALLIGDKVVDPSRERFPHEIDLGDTWRQHTGLPFVFAVWAVRAGDDTPGESLATLLSEARDRGVRRAGELAAAFGPQRGWPVDLAVRYLRQCLTFTLDARHVAGAERFARSCAALDLVPARAEIPWSGHVSAAGPVRTP